MKKINYYSGKLKHPKWQRKRLEIMQRDDFTCQMCKDTETTLHVHHLEYSDGEPWEIENDKLVTLCEICHEIIEDYVKSVIEPARIKPENIELSKIDENCIIYRINSCVYINLNGSLYVFDSPVIYRLFEMNERALEYFKNEK